MFPDEEPKREPPEPEPTRLPPPDPGITVEEEPFRDPGDSGIDVDKASKPTGPGSGEKEGDS